MAKVGVIGCGNISDAYFSHARLFADIDIVSCADLNPQAATRQAERYRIKAMPVADLMASDVDIVLNLTVPAAHAEIALQAIAAGKHVYGEKPLATTLADGQKILAAAKEKGLRVGSAPDTVLGAGYQESRALLDGSAIGRPLTGLAAFQSHGMENWHPNPDFFFQVGGGPVLDMGPYYITALITLLGPVAELQAVAQIGFAERIVTTEGSPMKGKAIKVETPTSVQALLSFASGAQVTLLMSWDVWRHGLAPIELHGEKGSMRLPDPNAFAGEIWLAEGRTDWRLYATDRRVFGKANEPPDAPDHANYRALGLAEMARAIVEGRPHRASGELGLHTLAVMEGILRAAAERRTIAIGSPCERPAPLGEAEAAALLRKPA